MFSDPDVYAAARTERASIAEAGCARCCRIVLDDNKPLRVLAVASAVVLALLRVLVAQAELQATVAGLQAGVLQGLLQLRRVAAQQIERLRLLDEQARGHLAVLDDI